MKGEEEDVGGNQPRRGACSRWGVGSEVEGNLRPRGTNLFVEGRDVAHLSPRSATAAPRSTDDSLRLRFLGQADQETGI